MVIYNETITERATLCDELSACDPAEWAEVLMGRTIEHINARSFITDEDQAVVERHARDLAESLSELRVIEDRVTRNAALGAIVAALSLGHYGASPLIVKEVEQQLRKQWIMPAHAGRRNDVMRKIIEERARDLWKREGRFKGKAQSTAANILKHVVADILALLDIPEGWNPPDLGDPREKKRWIEKIRYYVRAMIESEE